MPRKEELCMSTCRYRQKYANKFMVACDSCDKWYHSECVGQPQEFLESQDSWECNFCLGGADCAPPPLIGIYSSKRNCPEINVKQRVRNTAMESGRKEGFIHRSDYSADRSFSGSQTQSLQVKKKEFDPVCRAAAVLPMLEECDMQLHHDSWTPEEMIVVSRRLRSHGRGKDVSHLMPTRSPEAILRLIDSTYFKKFRANLNNARKCQTAAEQIEADHVVHDVGLEENRSGLCESLDQTPNLNRTDSSVENGDEINLPACEQPAKEMQGVIGDSDSHNIRDSCHNSAQEDSLNLSNTASADQAFGFHTPSPPLIIVDHDELSPRRSEELEYHFENKVEASHSKAIGGEIEPTSGSEVTGNEQTKTRTEASSQLRSIVSRKLVDQQRTGLFSSSKMNSTPFRYATSRARIFLAKAGLGLPRADNGGEEVCAADEGKVQSTPEKKRVSWKPTIQEIHFSVSDGTSDGTDEPRFSSIIRCNLLKQCDDFIHASDRSSEQLDANHDSLHNPSNENGNEKNRSEESVAFRAPPTQPLGDTLGVSELPPSPWVPAVAAEVQTGVNGPLSDDEKQAGMKRRYSMLQEKMKIPMEEERRLQRQRLRNLLPVWTKKKTAVSAV